MEHSTILVEVPTVTAGQRLLDICGLLAADPRVDITFAVPRTTDCWPAAEEFVRDQGGRLLSWPDAVVERFDLILTTAGRRHDTPSGCTLLVQIGTAICRAPDVIALSTYEERRILAGRHPDAGAAAVVAGDVRLARMLASVPLRGHYRRCLGVADEQTLITVYSTWTPDSTFGQYPDLCRRLVAEAPADRFRIAAVPHPITWFRLGAAHVRELLADSLRSGLLLLPPADGGPATAIASDWVIGDRGSATVYAAAIGTPVSLAAFPYGAVLPGSPADRLSRLVPRLDHCQPLLPQRQHAIDLPATGLVDAVTSRPGRVAETLRQQLYRLLGLPEPDRPAVLPALPDPRPEHITEGPDVPSRVPCRHGNSGDLPRPPR